MTLFLQAVLSFLVGGLFIGMQTLIAERVSPQWRGSILTIPSTLALSLVIIGLTKTTSDVVEAAIFFPAGMGISFVFVTLFSLASRYSLLHSLIIGYLGWIGVASLFLHIPPTSISTAVFLYAFPIALLGYVITSKLPQNTYIKPVPFNMRHVLVRSGFGGGVVCAAVVCAHLFGNIWGGLFAAFPATFSAALIIYYIVHGKQMIPAVGKALFFPGAIGLPLYAWVVTVTYPTVGVLYGTVAAFAVTLSFYAIFDIIKLQISKKV